jgi:hypothetical protein
MNRPPTPGSIRIESARSRSFQYGVSRRHHRPISSVKSENASSGEASTVTCARAACRAAIATPSR